MKVFISWSKEYSGKISSKLGGWLEEAFENNIDIFISQEGIESGSDWYRKISDELSGCELGILVLTSENVNSPWIMYEAGALSTKKAIIPILFERSPGQVEGPISKRHHIAYDKSGLLKLLIDVNKYIGAGFSEKVLKGYINETWEDLEKDLTPLVEKSKIAMPTIEREGLRSSRQDGVDLSVQSVFSVKRQTSLGVSVEEMFPIENIKVSDIPMCLERFAHENLDNEYCIREVLSSGDERTRFMINRTRVSNFVSFTDGERIAFFDRKKSSKETKMVENNSLDVFGAVHFENGSMLGLKITNLEFHDVGVEDIHEIPGFAFEDNESNSLDKETVIMFGYSVTVSPDNLDKIVSDTEASKIYLKHVSEDIPKSITAKAELAYKYIKRRLKI